LGLLPLAAEGVGFDPKNPQWRQNLWLGEYGNSTVGVGITGDYAAVRVAIDKYGSTAKTILFPYPYEFRASPPGDTTGLLLMIFDRQGLNRAAILAAKPPPVISR
jgi:hypothetical protein